jgi:hypothetical protein
MDILASMLAYLGCVTGIVGALAMSFYLFFAAPHQALTPTHAIAMATKPSVLMTAMAPQAKPSAKIDRADTHVASRIASDVSTEEASQATAAEARKKAELAHAQFLRRLVQEDRARRWAYQQDPSFETRFLGYTD